MGSRQENPNRQLAAILARQQAMMDRQYSAAYLELVGKYPAGKINDSLSEFIKEIEQGDNLNAALVRLEEKLHIAYSGYTPTINRISHYLELQARALGYRSGASTLMQSGITFGKPSLETIMAAISYADSPEFQAVMAAFGQYNSEWIVNKIAGGFNPLSVAYQMMQSGYSLSQASRLTRTIQLYSARQGTMMLYQAYDVGSWYWAASLELRTCPACWRMHGQVFPSTTFGPNDHHYGRCVAVPVVGKWLPPPRNGQELFAELPESSQIHILGRRRFEAWRNNEIDDIADIRQHQDEIFGNMIEMQSLAKSIQETRRRREQAHQH